MSNKLFGFVLASIMLTASATQVMASDNTVDTPTASITVSADKIYPAGSTPKIGIKESRNLGQNLVSIFRQLAGQSLKHTLKITDPTGEVELREISGDTTEIPLPTASLRPGTYRLAIDDKPVTDFSWGVLVINTSQSIYRAGDTAYIQMGSLDSNGHTLCGSRLQIIITDPQGGTESPNITGSRTCGADNVTDTPDHFSYYTTTIPGTYQIRLMNLDNQFETAGSFLVEDTLPIKVERVAATRINPFKSDYTMTIKITADHDWSGIVKEEVPQSFQIINSQTTWKTVLKAGEEKTFSYTYQAPKITPQIFLLGPLTVGNFREPHQWQLASDSPTSNSFQRKTWYDTTDSLYWRAYNDTANSRIVFEYSSNGTSWTENTLARIAVNTNDFSIEADSSNIFIVYTSSNDIRGTKASSYPGTGFGWGSEGTILNGSGSTNDYSYPVISRDSGSYVWVAARYTGSGVYYIKTIKEADGTNDLPEDSSDTVYPLSDTTNSNGNVYANIISVGSSNMYTVYAVSTALKGCKWVNTSTAWQDSNSNACSGGAGTVVVDGTVSTGSAATTPITVSHTTGSGENRLMLVGVSGAGTNITVSGVTYGGVSLGAAVGTALYDTYQRVSIYKLVAPTSGAANVVVTFSANPEYGAVVGVMTFTGVDQSTPLGTFAPATGDGTTPTVNVTSATGELVFDTVSHWNSLTVGGGQTQRWNTGQTDIFAGGSTEPGAASVTMSWTASTNTWAIGAVPIKPAADAGSQDSIDTIPANLANNFSAVSDSSGNVHLTYIDSSNHTVYREYTSSWQTAVTLDSNSGNTYPTIALNTTAGNLYAFWIRSSHIYYKKGVSPYASGNWDASATDWKTTGTNTDVTANYSGAGYIFAEWYDGSNVQWDKIIPSSNSPPNTPSLDSPADTATGQSVTPTLKTTATDPESDYIMYKIVICTNVGMSTGCQTFDETTSQTGWIGQNTQNSTAYTSGTQGVLIVPNALNNNATYFWDSYAIDPGGSNTFSSTQGTPRSFTTQASTALNSQVKGVIMQGVILK